MRAPSSAARRWSARRVGIGEANGEICSKLAAVSEPDLEELRRAIDQVDSRLLELIHERVRLVLAVGAYKLKNGVAIYDPERERRLLERLTALAQPPLEPDTVRRIFERLIDESRTLEQRKSGQKL